MHVAANRLRLAASLLVVLVLSLMTAQTGAAQPAKVASRSVLAPTPYMGWDTYFALGGHYSESTILEAGEPARSRSASSAAATATCGSTSAGGTGRATPRARSASARGSGRTGWRG